MGRGGRAPPFVKIFNFDLIFNENLCKNIYISYKNSSKSDNKEGSGAGYSVGPHSGRPVLLWSTMEIWILNFHFYRNERPIQYG